MLFRSEDEQTSTSDQQPYQYGKSYLKNPYGADFIRLEIDSARYKHNKTGHLGGIHHIPLKIHGYAETSEFPVSGAETEKPPTLKLPAKTERPVKFTPKRPKKAAAAPHHDKDVPFKAVRDAMETIPNAIQNLPDLMHSLVNHGS